LFSAILYLLNGRYLYFAAVGQYFGSMSVIYLEVA
jgi:hypothetical protein